MAANSKRGLNASKSRSNGMKGASGKARKTAAGGRSSPSLPGEKRVRKTGKAVGVRPAKGPREAGPTDPRAVDRRRQILEG